MRQIQLAVAALVATLALTGIAKADDAAFRERVKAYYDSEFAARPSFATRIGLHVYDAKLDDLSAAGYAATIKRLHGALDDFNKIDPTSLSPGDRDDREILISSIKGALLDAETIRNWRKDPGFYASMAAGAVFGLVHRDFAPALDRLRSVIARERQIPALLDAGKANIEHPPHVFVEIALRNVAGSLAFFKDAAPAAFAVVKDHDLRQQFAAANGAVIDALGAYKNWMEHDLLPHADGEFALGSALFAERLNDNEMVDVAPDRLLQIAEAQLRKDQSALADAAAKVRPGATTAAVELSIRADHPTADTLIPTARDELAGLRAFIVAHDILTIPSPLLPTVEETPGFQRATTAAAMDWPGPFELHATTAFYYVTPPEPGLSPERLEQYLQAYDFSSFELISAHEVWPGHFMQYLSRRAHPEWSLQRQLSHAQSTTEGWAHYTEQMMVDQGLGNGDPKIRVGQISEALLRDCRFIASLEMHTKGKSVEDAKQLFMKECGSPEPEAQREAWRGTGDPGYLNYTVGKLEILKLREDYQAKTGDKFSLAQFHDRFLAGGLAPVKIIRREMMGADGSLL